MAADPFTTLALTAAILVVTLTGGLGIARMLDRADVRRRRLEWEQHVADAARVVHGDRPTRATIRAAHEAELAEGCRGRHPAFRNQGRR